MRNKSGIIRVNRQDSLEIMIHKGIVDFWQALYDLDTGRVVFFVILK